jgi:hypothetical protein
MRQMLVGTARIRLIVSELQALNNMFERYKVSVSCTDDGIVFLHNRDVAFASIGRDHGFGASHPMFFCNMILSQTDSRRNSFGFDDTDIDYLPSVRQGILEALKSLRDEDEYTKGYGLEQKNVDRVALADL